jgi:hypothetical protein
VAPRAWYVGALEYSSTNPWGELAEERAGGHVGKAWLAVDLETGRPERRPVTLARRFIDLPPIAGEGRSAEELDREIAARVAAVSGGIKDQVVRLVVRDVPRHVARALNYGAVRNFKVEALHFDLDIRRPEIHRETGMGAPGRRQTLPELVQQYLAARLLPPGVDRDAFVKLGTELVDAVERELQES